MSDETLEGEIVEEPRALAVRSETGTVAPTGLFATNDPVEVIEQATRVANALKSVVVAKKLVSNIRGKEFPQLEAWLTLAAMLNLNPIIEWTRKLPNGWEARCVVKNAVDQTVSSAEAECTRDESTWAKRDSYALRSMAQTRATSKALSAKLRFIMVLAGYQGTPAEEMPTVDEAPAEPQTPPPTIDAAKVHMFDALTAQLPPEEVEAIVRKAQANYGFPSTGKVFDLHEGDESRSAYGLLQKAVREFSGASS